MYVNEIIIYIGEILVAIGVFCDLAASIGMLRFPNFYVRLHAATVGTIGGAFVPLVGIALIALGAEWLGTYRFFLAGASIITAIIIIILAPVGSHVLARATHKARLVEVEPKIVDHLEEDIKKKEGDKNA